MSTRECCPFSPRRIVPGSTTNNVDLRQMRFWIYDEVCVRSTMHYLCVDDDLLWGRRRIICGSTTEYLWADDELLGRRRIVWWVYDELFVGRRRIICGVDDELFDDDDDDDE